MRRSRRRAPTAGRHDRPAVPSTASAVPQAPPPSTAIRRGVMPWRPGGREPEQRRRPVRRAASASAAQAPWRRPAQGRCADARSPAQAIIAALSVQSRAAAARRRRSRPRGQRFAACAGPRGWRRRRRRPPAVGPCKSGKAVRKRARLRPTRSSSVARSPPGTRRRGRRRPRRSAGQIARRGLAHRRLQAGEGEVGPRLARAAAAAGRSARGSPDWAARSTFGPPG